MNSRKVAGSHVCGIPIQPTNLGELLIRVKDMEELARKGVGSAFCFINSNSIVEADSNPSYKELLISNPYNFADGTPVFILSQFKNFRSRKNFQKVPGPDFFEKYFESETEAMNQYFIGADEATLENIISKVGQADDSFFFFAPPHSSDVNFLSEMISNFLIEKPPGIVWLGLGGTKQDTIAVTLSKRLPYCFIGVGAAFDFFSGSKSRSPKIINQLGLEWLFRLVKEPRRLAKRYLLGNLVFIRIALHKEVISPCLNLLASRK